MERRLSRCRQAATRVSPKPNQSPKLPPRANRLETEGVCFALIIGNPSKPFGSDCRRQGAEARRIWEEFKEI